MTGDEVKRSIEAFVEAARRADRAGFDGVELHGAHGYPICEFLSPTSTGATTNTAVRSKNRARFLLDAIDGVRAVRGPDFSLGVRLSPERFGMQLPEIRTVAARLLAEEKIDYLDMSLWDCFKEPEISALRGRTLMSYFADLPRRSVRLGAAGKIGEPSATPPGSSPPAWTSSSSAARRCCTTISRGASPPIPHSCRYRHQSARSSE